MKKKTYQEMDNDARDTFYLLIFMVLFATWLFFGYKWVLGIIIITVALNIVAGFGQLKKMEKNND